MHGDSGLRGKGGSAALPVLCPGTLTASPYFLLVCVCGGGFSELQQKGAPPPGLRGHWNPSLQSFQAPSAHWI